MIPSRMGDTGIYGGGSGGLVVDGQRGVASEGTKMDAMATIVMILVVVLVV